MTRNNRAMLIAISYTFIAFFIAMQRDIDDTQLIDHYLALRVIVIVSCVVVIVSLHTMFIEWFNARNDVVTTRYDDTTKHVANVARELFDTHVSIVDCFRDQNNTICVVVEQYDDEYMFTFVN